MVNNLYLVDDTLVSETALKVLQVKALLAKGQVKNTTEALNRLNLSRSAYYKYKDHIFSYNEDLSEGILNIYAVLEDVPGVLSGLISALYDNGANILTVNQNIPIDGVAVTTLSIRVDRNSFSEEDFVRKLRGTPGVVEFRLLTGI